MRFVESCINKNTIKQKQYLTEKYKTLYKWNEIKSSHPEVKHAIVRFTWTLEILLTDWKYWVQTRRLCIHNCGKIFTFLLSSTCTFYQFILLLKFWTPLNHIATFKRKPNYLHSISIIEIGNCELAWKLL